MVIPFSNTKLRVPKGFQSLLVGLSTEILRSQPRNIHEFAADYFEKLVQRRDQGESYLPDKQTSLEDRYYNNQSFQEEYSVNDPDVQNAATKIQANFRGHKARKNVDKMRHENKDKDVIDTDQQELGYGRERTATPREDETRASHDDNQKSARPPSAHVEKQVDTNKTPLPDDKDEFQEFDTELTEEEKQEQDRAARSIQARFRGHKTRKSPNQGQASPGGASDRDQLSDRQQYQESDNDKASSRSSTRLSGKIDSDRPDLRDSYKDNEQIETGENNDTDRPRLEREPTQLSEDFERHTQLPRDPDFEHEQQANLDNDEFDMSDPNLEKAATRIQASFRGYQTRQELSTKAAQGQPPSSSPHAHNEHDHTEHKTEVNKEPEGEEDDNSAAVKIQAAYRGYRVRKDLEK